MDLDQFVDTPYTSRYPCHTVAVERAVAITSAASGKARSRERRLGIALARFSHIEAEKGE